MARDFRSDGTRGRHPTADEITAQVTAQVNEKVAQKLAKTNEKLAAKSEKLAAKMTVKSQMLAEQLDRLEQLVAPPGSAVEVWTRSTSGTRKPRFTRADLAAAAVRIADDEGLDALTMRRLAAELQSGTMTLYHYVRTKDELLTLLIDEVMAECLVADRDLRRGWRVALTAIARRTRAAIQAHPWLLEIVDDPAIGPNSVRHIDQSLQAVADLDVSLERRLDIVGTVDDFVFGYCLDERRSFREEYEPNVGPVPAYVEALVAGGGYPGLAAVLDELGSAQAWHRVLVHQTDPARFERNLARVLDGLEGVAEGRVP